MKGRRSERLLRKNIQESSESEEIKAEEGEQSAAPVEDESVVVLEENEGEEPAAKPDSNDDEAPESVSWSVSKEHAARQRKKEQEIVSAAKSHKKKLRQDKDEKLKQQKLSKEHQNLSRLPINVLEKVAQQQELAARDQEADKKKLQSQSSSQHITFDSEDEDEEIEIEQQGGESEDSKGVHVEVLCRPSIEKRQKVINSASEFLQSHFYGDRLKRIDSLKDIDLKRKHRFKGPAVKFAKSVR